jgi:hypothetical protein
MHVPARGLLVISAESSAVTDSLNHARVTNGDQGAVINRLTYTHAVSRLTGVGSTILSGVKWNECRLYLPISENKYEHGQYANDKHRLHVNRHLEGGENSPVVKTGISKIVKPRSRMNVKFDALVHMYNCLYHVLFRPTRERGLTLLNAEMNLTFTFNLFICEPRSSYV